MPFIHIRSLPLDPPLNVAFVLEGVAKDFAKGTRIDLEHVTATWEFLPAGHYVVAGRAEFHQPARSHPLLVELLSPDFNSLENVQKMLLVVATSISKRTKMPINNIFIHHRHAHSGMVFDSGEVVRW